MRILAINNYDLEWAYKKPNEVPLHQTWGVSYMREKGDTVDTLLYTAPVYKHTIISKLNCRLYDLFVAFKILHLNFLHKYDVIVCFFTPGITYLTRFKKYNILTSRLYTFVHHHFGVADILQGFDNLIYISENIRQMDVSLHGLTNTKLVDWNPDLHFYDTVMSSVKRNEDNYKFMFVSNGKTSREHNLVLKVMAREKARTLIFDPDLKTDQKYVQTTSKSGYVDMVQRMSECCVNLVPCCNDKNQICGLTSVIDGLAMGMPLLLSDSTNISFDIEKEGLGLYYKVGDEEDLTAKVRYMVNHPNELIEMGHNARKFAEEHSYKQYCEELYSIISE